MIQKLIVISAGLAAFLPSLARAETVLTFKKGIVAVPEGIASLLGPNHSVKPAWSGPRFTPASLARNPWEKAQRAPELAVLAPDLAPDFAALRLFPEIAAVEDNVPYPYTDAADLGETTLEEPSFPEPECKGIIYAFHHYSETDQKLEDNTSCDVFAIRPNGGFSYRIALQASTEKVMQIFEHGVKIAEGKGPFNLRFNFGTRQRYITVRGRSGAYHLEIYPNESNRDAEGLNKWNLSDAFSNGYGFGIPSAEALRGKARSSSQWKGAQMMQAASFWDSGVTGRGVKVAVIDTGIAHDHPFLQGSVVGGFTPFGKGTQPSDYADVQGHGSHVAGIIKQVAPDVQLMAVRVFSADDGGTTAETVAEGVRWAIDNGAQVINLSLGGPTAPASWESVFRYGAERGVLFAVASGNDRGFTPLFPAAYAGTVQGFGFSVGALDAARSLAVFSNWAGNNLNMKQVSAHGVKVVSVDYESDGLTPMSGTSMAAPQIAGYLALMKQAYPAASNQEIINRVAQHVRRAAIND